MSSHFRSTQRPPKSCKFCYQRKIKCDGPLPCGQCRRRGKGGECHVETVVVKGRLLSQETEQRSYKDVVADNKRLRTMFSQSSRQQERQHELVEYFYRADMVEQDEQQMFTSLKKHYRQSTVRNVVDILVPSDNCVKFLCASSQPCTWVEFAVDWADFRQETAEFLNEPLEKELEQRAPAAWLGLYFACLVVSYWISRLQSNGHLYSNDTEVKLMLLSEEKIAAAKLPHDNVDAIVANWYDAALFFLYKADFMRKLDLRNVQTIVILDIAYTNFGDLTLYHTLWACAVRIGQALGINLANPTTQDQDGSNSLSARIWWSLVMTDWLSFQVGQPCIREDDFTTPPPSSSDASNTPDHYFSAMAKTSTVLARFRSSLSTQPHGSSCIAVIVQNADNALADVIESLNSYLRASPSHISASLLESEPVDPSIEWQKESITIILLYYRIVINRCCLRDQVGSTEAYQRAFAIYLDSAHAILSIIARSELGPTQRLMWTFQLPLFTATSVIIAHGGICLCGLDVHDHLTQALDSIKFFESISDRSVQAVYAVDILKNMIASRWPSKDACGDIRGEYE